MNQSLTHSRTARLRHTIVATLMLCAAPDALRAQAVPASTLTRVEHTMVKIYGVGGLRGLESYQSGFTISADGHVVTADSLVLEQGEVTVVRHNGDRYSGRVVGADPLLEVAVLKIDPAGDVLPAIDASRSARAGPGEPLLVFANMFGIATGEEPVSVMRTHLAAWAARDTAFGMTTAYPDREVLLVDSVTSNPGAAGGLVTDFRGAAIGMIGRERRGRVTGTWLNYAVPIEQAAQCAKQVINGDQLLGGERDEATREVDTLAAWGFTMVENVAPRTPPYIEYVRRESLADEAGFRPDDLLVMVDGLVTASAAEAARVLGHREGSETLRVTLERDGALVDVELPGIERVEAR